MKRLLWLDLETTGLDPESCCILQVAAARTDEAGSITASHEWLMHVPWLHIAEREWEPEVVAMHTASGLLHSLRSGEGKPHALIVRELLKFVGPNKPVLAGNGIHFDRRFLIAEMPEVDAALHYRMLDVSALKVAAGVWGLPEYKKVKKHLALDDIKASIAEFMHWRKAFGR